MSMKTITSWGLPNGGVDPILFANKVFDEAAKLTIQNLPAIKQLGADIVEVVFVPKAILRQLLLSIALETGAITLHQLVQILRSLLSSLSARSRLIRQLQRKQQKAQTQDEWMDIAEQIDSIQGGDLWRSDPSCPLYEADRISARIDELIHLMRRRDIFDLMFTLRGGIWRNKFGLMHEGLFSKALAGSKVLVETYHNVVCTALEFVADTPVLPGDEPIPSDARLAFFNETRHSYGRTAMMFSGGAALGFYHMGVAKALMENGLMPRVISGASAGSIVCAMIGTRTNEECVSELFQVKPTSAPGHSGSFQFDFFRPLGYHKSAKGEKESDVAEVFHNTAGAFHDIKKTWQLFTPRGLQTLTSTVYDIITGHRRAKDILMSDTEHFRNCCKTNIGNFTFQEAFDRSGRILNITVSPQNRSDPPRLLNYLTAPHVLVWSAAVASSSLPGVFEANKLLVKDADGSERFESASAMQFQDGSMEADLPMEQLSEMFNVNHFIISQANPHAVMFSTSGLKKSVWNHRFINVLHGITLFVKNSVKAWFRNIVEFVSAGRISPLWDTRRGFALQFFTQEYVGRDIDITINPWAHHRSLFSAFLHLIYNPALDEFIEWIKAGERETWRHIPAIKSHCAEEMTLDRSVQRLRKRIMAESWQVHHADEKKAETTEEKMGNRVPSFFQSPSLVNLGGLGVGDRLELQSCDANSQAHSKHEDFDGKQSNIGNDHPFYLSSGWGGMGLHGNHSSALSLAHSTSAASGLFVMDASDDEAGGQEDAGELPSIVKKKSANDLSEVYVKTTNMADFYYRKTHSYGNLAGVELERAKIDAAVALKVKSRRESH